MKSHIYGGAGVYCVHARVPYDLKICRVEDVSHETIEENPMNNVPQVTPADVPAGAKIIDVREDYGMGRRPRCWCPAHHPRNADRANFAELPSKR